MNILKTRIANLIYKVDLNLALPISKKSGFHLDYENKTYRQIELCKIIQDAIPHFALTPTEFESLKSSGDIGEMFRLAWSRISDAHKYKKGDYGELLLFVLLSVFYDCPKFVTKVKLRSSKSDQIKGFDCAHFTLENNEPTLWLGEAKFHKTYSSAITGAIESINEHLEYKYIKEELSILYPNIEVNKENDINLLKSALLGKSVDKININIPVLLTYDSLCISNHDNTNIPFPINLLTELNDISTKIDKHKLALSPNMKVIFFMFAFKDVLELKTELEKIEKLFI